jgi:hypothetical protein
MITGTMVNPRCHWTDADELVFINFLLNHKADAGGSFKLNIWNAIAAGVVEHTTKGGIKVAFKCKAKCVSVCTGTVLLFQVASESYQL